MDDFTSSQSAKSLMSVTARNEMSMKSTRFLSPPMLVSYEIIRLSDKIINACDIFQGGSVDSSRIFHVIASDRTWELMAESVFEASEWVGQLRTALEVVSRLGPEQRHMSTYTIDDEDIAEFRSNSPM